MPHLLIAFNTSEGQTRKIAQRMADAVAGAGHEIELNDIRKSPSSFSVKQFDATIVGASIHLGKHSERFIEFVAKHRTHFDKIPSAFFSVSLSAAGPEEEKNMEARKSVTDLLEQTGWHPEMTVTFAGWLATSRSATAVSSGDVSPSSTSSKNERKSSTLPIRINASLKHRRLRVGLGDEDTLRSQCPMHDSLAMSAVPVAGRWR